MIAVRLMGGLGNQMFQYSLGRRLAIDHGVPLKLDLTFLASQAERKVDTPRDFVLNGWRISAEQASAVELAQFREPPVGRRARLLALLAPKSKGLALTEPGFGFDPKMLVVRPPALLIGYWQSAKYFAAIERELRSDFQLSHAPCEHIAPLLQILPDPNAISVHVRRGDYVHNPLTSAYHGVCSPEYYQAACDLIAARVERPRFIVFSDEPRWAMEHLKLPGPTTVLQHGPACQPHDDIWLMSRCSHHVIANSSFSWWGAWLGQNPDRIVVAPKRWFRAADVRTDDLLQEGWIRL